MKKPILIIGYGNPLRGDDAAGRLVAEAVADWDHPQMQSLSVHQLTPELAADIAAARRVVFVDAFVCATESPPEVTLTPLTLDIAAPPASVYSAHAAAPHELLAMAQALFGATPEACFCAIPACCFEPGAPLSSMAAKGVQQALQRIAVLKSDPVLSLPARTK